MKKTILTEAQVEAELRTFGIHKGFPAECRLLGGTLSGDLAAGDLAILWIEIRDVRKARDPAAVVAKMLEDGSWKDLLADIAAASPPSKSGAYPNMDPNPPQTTAEQEIERDAVATYCRLTFDRVSLADLAKEEGLSEPEVVAKAILGAKFRGRTLEEDENLRAAIDPKFAAERAKRIRALQRKPKEETDHFRDRFGPHAPTPAQGLLPAAKAFDPLDLLD